MGWYDNEPVPIILIGYTDQYEVDERYLSRFDAKTLAKKVFVRCEICKDLKEKRAHILCAVKRTWRKFLTPNSTGRRPAVVFVGLGMILLSFVGIISMAWMVFHR